MEERKENPIKRIAINLAHQMDDEKKLNHEFMSGWREDEIKLYGKQIRDEIWARGYDIMTVLHYAEEYKKLSMKEYMEWRYS